MKPVRLLIAVESKETALEKQLKEEEKILESVAEKTALMGVAELAKGIEYTEPIKTGCVFSKSNLLFVILIIRQRLNLQL